MLFLITNFLKMNNFYRTAIDSEERLLQNKQLLTICLFLKQAFLPSCNFFRRSTFLEVLISQEQLLFLKYYFCVIPQFFIVASSKQCFNLDLCFTNVTFQKVVSKKWRRGVVVDNHSKLHSIKPGFRFCAGSNPARDMLENHDGEDSDNGPGWK